VSTSDAHKNLSSALGRIPSGLFIVTARRGEAETGMLASWVQQCAFEPPSLSMAIQRGRNIADWLTEGSWFTINVLDDTQTDMIVHFGRGFALDEPAFVGLEIERPESGGPVLEEALAYLECRVLGRFAAGDHDLFLGECVRGRLLSEGHPMVHVRKSGFHY
jgi:flavin reductase (DIM6/NTAB) family NADH-FMN oxidoreductase RutF